MESYRVAEFISSTTVHIMLHISMHVCVVACVHVCVKCEISKRKGLHKLLHTAATGYCNYMR